MRCQEEGSGTGYEDGQHAFSTTVRFCDIKQRRNCSFLTSSSIAIKARSFVSDGSRIFNEFIVGVKSYMGSF